MSMDKFDRIFDLHRCFSARRTPATIDEIAVRLERNRSTAYRGVLELADERAFVLSVVLGILWFVFSAFVFLAAASAEWRELNTEHHK